MPLAGIIDLLIPLLPEAIVRLFECLLRSTYFLCQGTFFEQVERATMGSPLSPIVADLFLEAFEAKTIERAHLKPSLYRCYVDDTLLFWQLGQEELDN